jgi:NTE family protein
MVMRRNHTFAQVQISLAKKGGQQMKIGLALSGGGFRATGFHLGVLARLAEENRLEDVAFLSTVSGGSLCIGLVYASNDFDWPTSSDFIDDVVPKARKLLTTQDLQSRLLERVLRSPLSIFETRADDLSTLLRNRWRVTASLDDLPEHPRWMINATCYETGKNWRFERFRMGDYVFGYTYDTDIPLSDALAASAGFPGLIGPLVLDTRPYSWFRYTDKLRGTRAQMDADAHVKRKTEPTEPAYPKVHLWDGGVYDNLGLEGLHNFEEGWREGLEFLLVSDASGGLGPEKYGKLKALLRIIGILMDQVRSLRARAVLERLKLYEEDPGSFLRAGNTCRYVLRKAGREEEIANLCPHCLGKKEADSAAAMETEIRRLSQEEFELLFRHGFEVADYTLYAYHADKFDYIGYSNSRWC